MDICLIEPDALRRSVYGRYLHGLGYRVRIVDAVLPDQSGYLPHGLPDALIADLYGTGRRPLAFLTAMHERFPGIPSILLLGVEQDVTAEEAMRYGAKAILRDPVHLEDLGLQLALNAGTHGTDHRELPAYA